jgi:hypothetical protein
VKDILNRYAQAEDGAVIIDVYTDRPEYLYNDFDRKAPYMKKDLDQDFADYLIDCAREIGRHPFIIRINLPTSPSEDLASRIKNSIASYFAYLKSSAEGNRGKALRTSMIFLFTGLALLVLSLWAHQRFLPPESLAGRVMSEGLTVAAWVSLWEALANFLIQWPPHNREIKLYKRLAEAAVRFQKLS